MADWIKIGVKAGLIIVVTAMLLFVLTSVPLPAVDTSQLVNALGVGKAILQYWFPALSIMLTIYVSLLGLELAIWAVKIALIAIRWTLKVNE